MWYPIETAPREFNPKEDGIRVLVYEPGGITYVAEWHAGLGLWIDPGLPYEDDGQHENKPTHWTPIPTFPQE